MNDTPQHHGDDERLRRLLEDAVSDVEPGHGLPSIHARTKVVPMRTRRSRILAAGAAAVATAATVAGVFALTSGDTGDGPDVAAPPPSSATPTAEPSLSPSESTASPSSGRTTSSPSATGSAELATVPVYYLGDTSRGPRLYREFHRVPLMNDDPVSTAAFEAVAETPDDPDYRTPWPGGTTVATVADSPADVITVDVHGPGLHSRPATLTAQEARLAIEQLVYTAQAAHQSRSPVQLLLDGSRTDTLLGVPVSEPLAQGAPGDVLAQVWVIDPAEGAQVSSPFEVSGVAAAFEANVVWELRDGDRVVKEGFTTAEECCTMAPYSFEVTAPPGEYTLLVQDSDPSGGEGPAPWQDTKRITVVP